MKMNRRDVSYLIRLLEIDEDNLFAYFSGSPRVLDEDVEQVIKRVRILRQEIRNHLPKYESPYQSVFPV
jgi:succinate dehydrogenase flavin-adding protein (antitoxin of CptAB toxin-antitoxin module)